MTVYLLGLRLIFGTNYAVSAQILAEPDQACEGGGVPKKSCPYWNVTYSYTSGMLGSVTVTCSTGGSFTCVS